MRQSGCFRAECSRREAESGATLYFREVWMWKGSFSHTLFSYFVVWTVILNMRWLFVEENEGLVCRGSRAQLTCLWLSHSAGCVAVCVSVSYSFQTHWLTMCCIFFFLGGGYLSCKCETLIWLFYCCINIKVWMVKALRKLAFTIGKKCGGVHGPLSTSLYIHWRSQTVAMWQNSLDQNSNVQSY